MYKYLLDNYRVLDKSTNVTWNHYLWVNNKTMLPETVANFEDIGVIVKEWTSLSKFN
jgi:hypothetical protein